MAEKRINLTKDVFLKHPVPTELKHALNAKGYRITDIEFAPRGYKPPKELVDFIPADEPELFDQAQTGTEAPALATPPAQPANESTPSNGAGSTETPAQPAASEGAASEHFETMLGSDNFASTYTIGDKVVQLGELVALAGQHTNLSIQAWNKLDDATRDYLIGSVLDALQYGKDVAKWLSTSPEDRKAELALDKELATANQTKAPEEMTQAELRAAIEAKTGNKPTWNAKHETLVAQFKAMQ